MARPSGGGRARKSKRLSTVPDNATSPPPTFQKATRKTESAPVKSRRARQYSSHPKLEEIATAALASAKPAPETAPTATAPAKQPTAIPSFQQQVHPYFKLPQLTPPRTTLPTTPHPLFVIIDTEPYERTFSLNRARCTKHSKLLRRAASQAPRPDLAIALPGIRAVDFEAYAAHYSTVREPLAIHAERQWEQIKPEGCELSPAQKTHVRVATLLGYWVMGNQLQDLDFKNAAMDAILAEDLAGDGGAAVVQCAGEILGHGQTSAKSGLYRLLVDVVAPMMTGAFVEEYSGKWSKEFLVDLFKKVLELRGGQDVEVLPTPADKLRYYEVEAEVVERLVGAVE
ncbi:hypothetical protein PRZ48_013523 [Zasmidium cellare]|uniref:Uncharacterized protein n=1 Tax=Zasmidium cellare TaxID=395010 RepID=A0ABR0E194_ZASCE|nr:hypothetical protein PRZ48_013523 [Zasmidium cellare]